MSSTDGVIEPLPKGDLLVEAAYRRLREAILSNRLPPGTPLSVPEFARRFQVSRSPVREAVQRLVFEGLAINVVHKGAEVAGVQLSDLQQLYVVREVLEGLSARLATERIDAGGLAVLRRILDEHEHVVEVGEEQGHIEFDMAFHRTIREACGNEYLITTLNRLEGKSHLALFHLWRGPDGPRFAVDEHRRVYAAMAAGDSMGADEAARAHIAQLRVRLNQYAGAKPGRPRGRGDDEYVA
jgi:DNA-binding GntR family transcriptional regulator